MSFACVSWPSLRSLRLPLSPPLPDTPDCFPPPPYPFVGLFQGIRFISFLQLKGILFCSSPKKSLTPRFFFFFKDLASSLFPDAVFFCSSFFPHPPPPLLRNRVSFFSPSFPGFSPGFPPFLPSRTTEVVKLCNSCNWPLAPCFWFPKRCR